MITFSWSQIPFECQSLCYNILASNCGTCPATTTLTSVTCTDTPTDDGVCMFAVQVVVCNVSVYMSKYDIVSVNLSYHGTLGSTAISAFETCNDFEVRFYAALTSACFFATLFFISICFTLLCLKRKTKVESALELPTAASTQGTLTCAEDINATENIAYEHNTIIRTIKTRTK